METTIDVVEPTQVAQARRLAAEVGRAQGLSEADLGRAALIATEAATNLVKYGKKGRMTISAFFVDGANGIQFIAVDQGPGFADFQAAARDGHSTGGSLGFGLGTIMRAADLFDVYTAPVQGSAFLARVGRKRMLGTPVAGRLSVGSRREPKRGETECGDAWAFAASGGRQRVCVADGLGHGPRAALAADAAMEVFRAAREQDTPVDILTRCHDALKSTRGAVMAVATIDIEAGVLSFAGVGNIAAKMHSGPDSHHLLSTEGIVGYQIHTLRGVEHAWSASDTLVLCSDGLSGRWNLGRYPGLLQRHPVIIASVLFRDFARDTDDATVVVAKDLR